MARLPADPEGFIRNNTALEAPALVPEFKLWLATEYVPIWQATESWLDEHNVDPPYWAFCWPGGQAIARYLLDNPEQVRGKRVIDFAAGSGVSSMAAARAGARSVIANDIDALSLVAAPVLYRSIGMGGLFIIVGVLTLAAILVVAFVVPDAPPSNARHLPFWHNVPPSMGTASNSITLA